MNISALPNTLISAHAQESFSAPSLFEKINLFPPILKSHMGLNFPYPDTLLRTVETALLNNVGQALDKEYFRPIFATLESALQDISLDCPKEEFWLQIVAARAQLYNEQGREFGGNRESDNSHIPPWQRSVTAPSDGLSAGPAIKPPTLKQLSLNEIVRSLQHVPELGEDILADQAALVFALMQGCVTEFTKAAKAGRPDLSDVSGTLCTDVQTHIDQALELCNDLQRSPDIDAKLLLSLERELMWASYYAGGIDHSTAAVQPNEDELAGIIAVESVRHRIAEALEQHR